MSKKRQFESDLSPAQKELEKYDLPALKRQVIMRGLGFMDVSKLSVLNMQGWFLQHYEVPKNESFLLEYDKWLEALLIERGAGDLINPAFRLSGTKTVGDKEVKVKRFKDKPNFKTKRVKTAEGIRGGTKKALTFDLQSKGIPRDQIITRVMDQFPDALEKSIIIWFNKARRLQKAKKEGK